MHVDLDEGENTNKDAADARIDNAADAQIKKRRNINSDLKIRKD